MLKLVIYGATPEDPQVFASLGEICDITFEKDIIQSAPRYNADIVALFTNSTFTEHNITPNLKAVICRSTGTDHIRCKDELSRRHIQIFSGGTYAAQAVVEYVLHCIFHNLGTSLFNNSGFHFRPELGSKTVAVLGYGATGMHLTRVLTALGCAVLVVSDQTDLSLPKGARRVPLMEAAKRADIVCTQKALTADNAKMLGEDFFGALKPGALFINVARGELVDNNALLKAIEFGVVRQACLDLVNVDEYKDRLLERSEVIYTNHQGWATKEALVRSHDRFIAVVRELVKQLETSRS